MSDTVDYGNATAGPPLGGKPKNVAAAPGIHAAVEAPFQPATGKTTLDLLVGPTATPAGVLALAPVGVIGAGRAGSYRVRNAVSSASPVTVVLTTDPTEVAQIPGPFAVDGTGGTLGDKTIDPGSVEVFTLTPDQRAALTAGLLFLSAVTPSGGSALISVTPGVGA